MLDERVEIRPWPRNRRYLVGSDGTVSGPRGDVLKGSDNGHGYLIVTVNFPDYRKSVTIHEIVCETFYGARPAGLQVAHENGDRRDNRASNLRWAAPKENAADRTRHRRTLRGAECAWQTKLTDEDVRTIRFLYFERGGMTQRQLAEQFNISHVAIGNVLRGRTWKHVA